MGLNPRIKTAIKNSQNAALDTNIFIFALQDNQKGKIAQELLRLIDLSQNNVSLSVLVLLEYLSGEFKRRWRADLNDIKAYLTNKGKFNLIEISESIAVSAARLRAKYTNLRTPDALHLASASECGAVLFFTFDRHLSQIKENRIKIIIL